MVTNDQHAPNVFLDRTGAAPRSWAVAVTIKDVAARANVSMITVSRVINGSVNVGEATRSRVEAAIDELQYVPNQMASNLRSQQSDTIALLLPDITTSFWTTIARGVEDEAWSRGYGMFLCNTDDDPEKEARYIDILLRRRVEGILIVPTLQAVPRLQRLEQRSMKFVILHRNLTGIEADVVRADSEGGTRELTSRLIDSGLRRIAYVGGPMDKAFGRDRLAGFEGAMGEAGLPVDRAFIKLGPYSQQTGYVLANELTENRPHPEGLVIGNSRLAVGALKALADNGVRVPEDIAVAAFHDMNALDDYAPKMITAVQPSYDIGRIGVRRLLEDRTEEQQAPREIILHNTIKVLGAESEPALARA